MGAGKIVNEAGKRSPTSLLRCQGGTTSALVVSWHLIRDPIFDGMLD